MTPQQIDAFASSMQMYGITCYDSRYGAGSDEPCKGKLVFYKIRSASPSHYISCKSHFDLFCKQESDTGRLIIVPEIFDFTEKDIFYLRMLLI